MELLLKVYLRKIYFIVCLFFIKYKIKNNIILKCVCVLLFFFFPIGVSSQSNCIGMYLSVNIVFSILKAHNLSLKELKVPFLKPT